MLDELIASQSKDMQKRHVHKHIVSPKRTKLDIPGDTIQNRMIYALLKIGFSPLEITELRHITESAIYRKMQQGF